MQIGKKACALSLSALLFAPLVGCGGSSASAVPDLNSRGPSGKVIQGAVYGSTVWADDVAAGTHFSLDTAEQATKNTTNSAGVYTFPITPNYKYVMFSQGGIDTITGKNALTLLAPGGAQSISPLTTMVGFDVSGNLAGTLAAILPAGRTFDSDFTATGGLTPAGMVFLTSVTTAITTLDLAIQDAATKSGASLTSLQVNDITLTLFSQMANQFATLPAAALSNTASLAGSLQNSLCSALTAVTANNTNITGLNCAIAATIANDSVATAANVVGNALGNSSLKLVTATNVQTAPGVSVSTSTALTESTVLYFGTNLQTVVNTITSVATSVATGLTVTSTPPGYAPPPLPLINNPTIIGYNLLALQSGNVWNVRQFTITFSDDMVASQAGDSTYAHSVLNPANYQFNQPGCSPSSYADHVVSLNCGTLNSGAFTVKVFKSNSTGGVWASATSLGLPVDNLKTFNLIAATGSTSINLF